MKLSDIMGHAGLSGYAEIALVLFFVAFLAVIVRTFRMSDRAELDHVSRLPLEEDTPVDANPGDRT